MSQENVETIKALEAALNRGDLDTALSYATPDIKYDNSRALNETRGIYETREGAKRAWERFFGLWDSWRVETDEFVHVGEDTVVTRGTGYLRGRDGIEVTARTSAVWTFRDGAISEFVLYNDLAEALEAAGVEE
jgi:ketosteroid isomerase-like protein